MILFTPSHSTTPPHSEDYMNPKNCITLRQYLQGTFNEFVKKSKIREQTLQLMDIVCESVSLIYDYKEEGTSLFLDLYITDAIKTIMQLIPGGKYIKFGELAATEENVKKALKKIAPLSRNKWKLYFCYYNSSIEFGIFRDSGNPIVPPIEAMLINPQIGTSQHNKEKNAALKLREKAFDELHVIRIAKIHHSAVIVSTQDGTSATVLFNYVSPNENSLAQSDIDGLSTAICQVIKDEDQNHYDACITFARSLLGKALRESHGALVAVVNEIPSCLNDGILIETPIDIGEIIKNIRKNTKSTSLDGADLEYGTDLEYFADLITGMFCCDGIVVFSQKFSVIAYNVFIKSKNANTFGGARSRAFEALCENIDNEKEIVAAFYQSQDGPTKFKKAN